MSSSGVVALLVAVIVIIVGAAIFLGGSGDDGQQKTDPEEPVDPVDPDVPKATYSISYVLNGGTLVGTAPKTYESGQYADLPYAENGELFFDGWFTDEGCTTPIGAILESQTGDLTLYAAWSGSKVGTGFTMSIDGSSPSIVFKRNYTGTATWEYLGEDDGAYYVERTMKIGTKHWYSGITIPYWWSTIFGSTTTEEAADVLDLTEHYWTDDDDGDDTVFFYRGNETLTGNFFGNGQKSYVCEVWESEDGTEKQWVYRSFYPLKIETFDSGLELNYSLTKVYEVNNIVGDFEPTVYAEYGITVTGYTTLAIGETLTLTAYGQDFYGWYIDGKLQEPISRTLTDDRATPDKVYEARTDVEYYVLESNTLYFEDVHLVSPVTIYDDEGKEYNMNTGVTFSDRVNGIFTPIDSREPVPCILRVYKEKTSTFSCTWEVGKNSYSMSFTMHYNDLYDYSKDTDRADFSSYRAMSKYFTYDDPYVKIACEKLLEYKSLYNMNDRDFAYFVMKFVETIPYLYDESSRGKMEFIKYPAELFWDGGGDCEDSSILYCTLMKKMGYDTALLIFRDHAMASIHFVNDSYNYGDNVATKNGKKYVYVETTTTGETWSNRSGYDLGDIFDDAYKPSKIEDMYVLV